MVGKGLRLRIPIDNGPARGKSYEVSSSSVDGIDGWDAMLLVIDALNNTLPQLCG
jgi:hypothetical protein